MQSTAAAIATARRRLTGKSFQRCASDGFIENGRGHPRTSGTYAKVLGRYVRDEHAVPLIDALRRMTLEPARRLERRTPGMVRKGRIAPGADADLVVFDPNYRGTISAKTQHMNVDYSAFEGWPLEGRASVVTVRGQVAARDGKFTGTLGRGRLLQRKPTHF